MSWHLSFFNPVNQVCEIDWIQQQVNRLLHDLSVLQAKNRKLVCVVMTDFGRPQ